LNYYRSIYEFGVNRSEPVEFVSAPRLLSAAAEAAGVSEAAAGNLLHTVFGMSKDFCMSGMRVGWVYSCNQNLHKVTLRLK
jgi:aspartate/methionine/tyrosine aminotransferase